MERNDSVILSSDDSDSDTEMKDVKNFRPAKEITAQGTVLRRAEMYQDYMKHIRIPTLHGSAIPCNSWQSLAKSLKKLYGQPLHYLTNALLKQWDQSRIGSDKEYQPLDTIIHPRKAEATIWLMEEAHRLTTSPHHLAKLWLMDPMHHSLVDPIFPQM